MTENTDILCETQGRLGLITLNRPQALNALTLPMVRRMDAQLAQWAEDPAVAAVAVRGAGDRAFCSGGDVKAAALGDAALRRDFFREEYSLNHRIHGFPKPYIALAAGIVMGGGKGVSAHGSHRVVTENTVFAMPETGIGFFPDVGGGWFLPRCPGQTGLYLALTSKRITAADTDYIGFATHFVPGAKVAALTEALGAAPWTGEAKAEADGILSRFAAPPPGTPALAAQREEIDRLFGHDRMEDIVLALRAEDTPFATEALTALHMMSPTSLKVALRHVRLGARLSFSEVMTMEYRISQVFMKGHDFYEGIRAALIDKDRKPVWKPARLSEVSDADVAAYFQSLGADDLLFA